MQSLIPTENSSQSAPPDLEREVSALESLLAERRAELASLQEEFRAFKSLYVRVVGSRLAELSEIESEIRKAEARLFGLEAEDEPQAADEGTFEDARSARASVNGKTALRKLFWSVARLFHPDHAADEKEAQRRHAVMREASRAYSEGDIESLHTLLGDEQLQFFCASNSIEETEEDLTARLVRLKGELRTVEFGIRRIEQDGLYRLKLKTEEEAAEGRDHLAITAEGINRKIAKALNRLEHLTS